MNRLTSFMLTAMVLMPLASFQAARLSNLPGEKSKDTGEKTANLNAMVPARNKRMVAGDQGTPSTYR